MNDFLKGSSHLGTESTYEQQKELVNSKIVVVELTTTIYMYVVII